MKPDYFPAPPSLGPMRTRIRDWLLAIVAWLQGAPVWPTPFHALFALEDHAANLYVWVVKENYSGEANEIADGIVSAYTKRRGRTPAATHLVTSTPVDVLAMTKEQLLHVLHSTGESVNPST